MVVVCGFHGRWLLFACCCVICVFLLSLLGGHGGCCRSWTTGIVSSGGLHVMLHGGDMAVKQMWVVIGQCVEVVGDIVGVVFVG